MDGSREAESDQHADDDVALLPEARGDCAQERITHRGVGERMKDEDVEREASDEETGPGAAVRVRRSGGGARAAGRGRPDRLAGGKHGETEADDERRARGVRAPRREAFDVSGRPGAPSAMSRNVP